MDCNQNAVVQCEEIVLLPWPSYNKFFKVVKESDNGKNLYVKCNLCVGNSMPVSTSKISSSNLKKHIIASKTFMFL